MKKLLSAIAAATALFATFISAQAVAGDCSPHCAWYHDYGPYNFSYIRPGLFGFPICDRHGDCSPYLVYVLNGHKIGSITIRSTSRHSAQHPFGEPKNKGLVGSFR